MSATPAVVARGLRKAFGGVTAVDGIDFTIAAQECFGFLGPNGAGKTTTMRILSCLARRDGGELSVLGLDPAVAPRMVKRRMGVVAQEMNLDVELTVRENLLVYARYFDLDRRTATTRTGDLLRFAQLEDRADDSVERLSGGMRRRIQIARALVNEPEIVLLDEPTTGLDPQARHLVWTRLRDLKARGVTLVLTTHYMDEAEQLCDRLVVMDRGRIVRSGRPRELVQSEVGDEVVEIVAAAKVVTSLVDRLGRDVRGHHTRDDVTLLFCDDGDAVARAAAGVDGAEVRAIRRSTLEDLFLAVTGHELRDGA